MKRLGDFTKLSQQFVLYIDMAERKKVNEYSKISYYHPKLLSQGQNEISKIHPRWHEKDLLLHRIIFLSLIAHKLDDNQIIILFRCFRWRLTRCLCSYSLRITLMAYFNLKKYSLRPKLTSFSIFCLFDFIVWALQCSFALLMKMWKTYPQIGKSFFKIEEIFPYCSDCPKSQKLQIHF